MPRGHRTNPSVDRYLEDKDMDHIDHALGRPVDPLGETYRNRFATGGDLADRMAVSPHWEEFCRSGDMRFFGVTDEGRKALVQYLTSTGDKMRKFAVEFAGHTSIVVAASPAKARRIGRTAPRSMASIAATLSEPPSWRRKSRSAISSSSRSFSLRSASASPCGSVRSVSVMAVPRI